MHNNLLTQLIITYNIFIFYIQYQKIDISLIYEDHMFNILKKRRFNLNWGKRYPLI